VPSGLAQTQSPDGLRRIVFYSLLAGAAALIPIPLLDDWAFGWVRRRMAIDLLRDRGASVDRSALRVLAGERDRFQTGACLYKFFFATVILPIRVLGAFLRGIFRKILFFLAVKQAADWASKAFHEGYILRHALRSMEADPVISDARARHLRNRIRLSLKGVNRSPIWGIFAGVFQMHKSILKRAAAVLARIGSRRGTVSEESTADVGLEELGIEKTILEELVNRTMDVLGGERSYLESLEARYDAAGTNTVS
jgi:hypothetical protein